MARRGEVLVAIINNLEDFRIARDEHWYRIPVSSKEKWLNDCWRPEVLAFYQTKTFGEKAHAIHYSAKVTEISEAYRWKLFPNYPRDEKTNRKYYQLHLEELERRDRPIYSRRWRRIIFIPTTFEKFEQAVEINDLYDESPLEDRLWAVFKQHGIIAERQEHVRVKKTDYFLDFAIYCRKGNLDVETDGDTYHTNKGINYKDNIRDNALEGENWRVLRFNTKQIMEEMEIYTLPAIADMVNDTLDGIKIDDTIVRKIDLKRPGSSPQLGLFDER